ncbi:hypothetical protein [Enterococcus sp.]|jgi:hypothetical protein|uniref:hypothetical protein n=1 Tax=Enterococcus sp. TaxID=35783 RepID=UPI0025C0719E|nr:hypothetical protein [Enterococcus sp.]
MKRKITRNTGFYAMGSPLEVLVDGQKAAWINQQETIELELDSHQRLSVRLFFLKSKEISLTDLKPATSLEIKMNPRLITFYVLFYIGLFLLVALFSLSRQLWVFAAFFLYLVGYFFLGITYRKQAYVIEEVTNG